MTKQPLIQKQLAEKDQWLGANKTLSAKFSLSQPSATLLVVVALLVAGAISRLYLLTAQSLWFDEGSTIAMTDSKSLLDTYTALWSVTGGDKYQALYFAMLSVWRQLVGDSEFALRLFSVIPGVLTPVVVYLATKRVFGARHALYSSLFILCSAFCVSYSQEVRPYSLLLFLAAFQLLFFAPALAHGASALRHRLWFAVITLFCCSGSILLLVFSCAIALAHLLTLRDIRSWLRWWVPAMLIASPVLLYYLATPAASNLASDTTNSIGVPLYQNALFSLYGHVAGQTYGPPLGALRNAQSLAEVVAPHVSKLLFLAVMIVTLAVSFIVVLPRRLVNRTTKSGTLFFIWLFVLSLAFAAILAAVTQLNWMPRHSFYLTIPLCVLLPMGICRQSGSADKRRFFSAQGFAMAAFAGLLAVNLHANFNYFFKSEYWRDDYRSAASYLKSHVGEEDSSLMLWGETRLLSYYGDNRTLDAWRLHYAEPVIEKIQKADVGGEIYVAINREFSWARESQSSKSLEQIVDGTYDVVSVQNFVNFSVYGLRGKQFAVGDLAVVDSLPKVTQ